MSGTRSYDEDVHQGVWINHAAGRVKGATLTLDRQSGAFLIAFLALFVAATGRSCWKITRFALHMSLSTDKGSDALHHQRLAVLRNSSVATDAAKTMIQARWAWRRSSGDVNKKTLPVAIFSGLVAIAFIIAGIFSSRVTTDNANEVLLAGRNCGNMTPSLPVDKDELAAVWTSYYASRTQKASGYLNYAFNCYQKQPLERPQECNAFRLPVLPYTKNLKASCPFDEEMCALQHDNLWLDTGMLDSSEHLGLNDGPRFQMQLARHCAPLVTDNYTDTQQDPSDPSLRWTRYYYGKSSVGNRSDGYRLRYEPARIPRDYNDITKGGDYKITEPVDIEIIPQLNKTGSVTSLLFLESSSFKNYARVDDPWFRATKAEEVPALVNKYYDISLPDNKYWVADQAAGVLGCRTFTKLCNPDQIDENKRCFNPTMTNVSYTETWPDMTDRAIIRGHIQYMNSDGLVLYPTAYYLTNGLPSLLARFTLLGPMQPSKIPANQWQKEMEYTFQANLAALQGQLIEHATGRTPQALEAFATKCGGSFSCSRLCNSQKVRTSSYYSFSILGISIIICVGALILLAGLFVESTFDLTSKIFNLHENSRLRYARIEWDANSTLQLQRLAHENIGSGRWKGAVDSIPVTQGQHHLATLDISNPEHPRLVSDREMSVVEFDDRSSSRTHDLPAEIDRKTKSRSEKRAGYKPLSTRDES